jgi:hypothetical protein
LEAPAAVAQPISAYALFMKSLKDNQEFMTKLKTEKKMFLSEAAQKWNNLTD